MYRSEADLIFPHEPNDEPLLKYISIHYTALEL